MLLSSIITQLRIMRTRKEWKAAWLILMVYAGWAFLSTFQESVSMMEDMTQFKDASESIGYSSNCNTWPIFLMLYPFLIPLPFATSYIDD